MISEQPAAFVSFESDEVRAWLSQYPREVGVAIAARAALRTLPRIISGGDDAEFLGGVVLSIFRAALLSWTTSIHPPASGLQRAAARAEGAGYNAAVLNQSYGSSHPAHVAIEASAIASASAARSDDRSAINLAAIAISYDAQENGTGFSADANWLQQGANASEYSRLAVELAAKALWPDNVPEDVADAWAKLRQVLVDSANNWDVWVYWYEDRLYGRPSLSEIFDIAVATLPDELWKQGPAAVNARIKELIAEHTPPEPIPAQGAGPQFGLNPDLKIALAPPVELDADGNNLRRIRDQLPLVRQAANDLAASLNPNYQPLFRNLTDYCAAIAGEPDAISWGVVFGLGVRLDNAAAVARRQIEDRLLPPLEDSAQEALDSVLMLHGPLILATREGQELAETADGFRLTREQQAVLRDDAQTITDGLKNSPELIESTAAELGQKAAESIGEGDHPERGTAFGMATVKNVATVLISAGTLAAFVPTSLALGGLAAGAAAGGVAWVGYEALKESQRFNSATSALGAGFDHLHDLAEAQVLQRLIGLAPFRRFVRANEEPLRRIAENSTQLRWMTRYIDFITHTDDKR